MRRAEDLVVWKLCDQVRRRVREIVARPDWQNHPSLRRQLEDAAESACPNVREGFDRYHPRDNARFVRIAKASLGETVDHLSPAHAKGLVTSTERADLTALCNRARAAAINFIRYLETAHAPNVPRTQSKHREKPDRDAEDGALSSGGPELWTDARADDPRWSG